MTTLDERLEALLAGRPEALAEAPALYAAAREADRVYRLGPLRLVTRYEDVKLVVRDHERFSSRALVEGSRIEAARARLDGDALAAFDEVTAFFSGFPSRNDGADHMRLRTAAHRAFTPRRMAALEQTARGYLDEAFAALAGGEGIDFMEVAFRLPLLVVADLLGVPGEDTELIHAWSLVLAASVASVEPEPHLAAREVVHEFQAYVDGMVSRSRAADASTDLVALLLGAHESDELAREELTALFVQILFAGHETTTSLIATGVLELLRSPDEWRALVDDPSLVPGAVEELLRIVSPSQFASRLARVDLELGGIEVQAGQTVLGVLAAANRDPEVFPRPDAVDVRREEAMKHLAFGFGPHFCLGASLARLEARLVLETLVERFPGVELAGDDLPWTGGAMLRRLVRLPVRLGSPTR